MKLKPLLKSRIDPNTPWDKLGYLQWHERAEEYTKAGIQQSQCGDCSRWFWPDETHKHDAFHTCWDQVAGAAETAQDAAGAWHFIDCPMVRDAVPKPKRVRPKKSPNQP